MTMLEIADVFSFLYPNSMELSPPFSIFSLPKTKISFEFPEILLFLPKINTRFSLVTVLLSPIINDSPVFSTTFEAPFIVLLLLSNVLFDIPPVRLFKALYTVFVLPKVILFSPLPSLLL